MRFGLKCIIALAILYRAILMSQGGAGTAALSSTLAEAVPVVQARVRDEIASRATAYCGRDPAACLSDAARLASFTSVVGDASQEPRRSKHGAIAAASR